MRDADGCRIVAALTFLDEQRIPSLNVAKISFRDMHAGQHHVPLAPLPIPQ